MFVDAFPLLGVVAARGCKENAKANRDNDARFSVRAPHRVNTTRRDIRETSLDESKRRGGRYRTVIA
jgi:hypothetical protein